MASHLKGSSNPKKDQNLEFNFDTPAEDSHPSKSMAHEEPILQPLTPSPLTTQTISPSQNQQEQKETVSFPKSPNPQTYSKPMANPSFSQYQQNVLRQSREQKAVGSLLSGVAIVLVIMILLVAGLAGYGTWFLWKQIQQQSVSVDQIDSKFTAEVQNLKTSLKETVAVVDELTSLIQTQKQQIASLQSQLEENKKQMARDRSTTQAQLKKLENRMYDAERDIQTEVQKSKRIW